jgi:pilus assembly protein CpaF
LVDSAKAEKVAVRSPIPGRRRLAQRLAAPTGRRLDDAQPWVDARLADGVRLHAVLPPVAPAGTCLSLRVPRTRVFTLAELVSAGSVPPDGAALLDRLVASRAAFLVTGGTGTGKTTLLSALLSLVPSSDRLLLVEDAGELAPAHPHVVRLEARPPNLEGAGAVTLRDLVRQALRMRPDRVVVGEVRGAEVVDLLAALNTGHEGGCGTLHANSARDVPARLEALAAVAGLARDALHSQLASGLRVAVHLVRARDGQRRVAEVCLLARGGDGLVRAEAAWSWDGEAPPVRPDSAGRGWTRCWRWRGRERHPARRHPRGQRGRRARRAAATRRAPLPGAAARLRRSSPPPGASPVLLAAACRPRGGRAGAGAGRARADRRPGDLPLGPPSSKGAGRDAERAGAVEACGALAAELRSGRDPADALAAPRRSLPVRRERPWPPRLPQPAWAGTSRPPFWLPPTPRCATCCAPWLPAGPSAQAPGAASPPPWSGSRRGCGRSRPTAASWTPSWPARGRRPACSRCCRWRAC